ncbi:MULTISPECIES: KilA-N domain-containing protein [unclassified Coleofasciculus]|uniref:KilA-N domain-containing protein n=1 Tax=unclassified Coleofasciculus TaxID=2692782 RepID=UPI0018828162|nr:MULTISPECIES: KilA-N domain-containing protein [unclassified Coleofasciculus]MBE9128898.1 KilA-N domain-containing protein [Coleofasciculus sp. LEGE 07081]MBE9151661.1 KilA-N domain-containing protein [Coleofasciculus sp. LEGE 07092]
MKSIAPLRNLSTQSTPKSSHREEFQQLELFEWTVRDPQLESRNISGSQVRRRNGLISLTDMWRVAGSPQNRTPPRWLRQEQTQLLIESISRQFKGEIAYSKRGRNGGTFAVDELAFKYWEYLNSKHRVRLTEKSVQKRLAKSLGKVQREVPTLAGNIDILTERELIEVKSVKSWKCAVGQVIVYGQSYPDRQKRIHLFGEASRDFLSMIRSYCAPLDIDVTWEN